MASLRYKKWRHPKTNAVRVYINGLDEVSQFTPWFEPAGDKAKLVFPHNAIQSKISEWTDVIDWDLTKNLDLDLKTMTWEALLKQADW